MIKYLILVAILISGCGDSKWDSGNPFHPDNPGQFCDLHGGVQLIEGGYIYGNDGTYIEESAL